MLKLIYKQALKPILLISILLLVIIGLQTISLAATKTRLIPVILNGMSTQLERQGIRYKLTIEPGDGVIVSCASRTPEVKSFNLTDIAQRSAGTVYYLGCPDLIRGISFEVRFMPPETTSDPALETAILREAGYSSADSHSLRYFYNKIDLNDDNIPEILVYLSACGSGGCTLQIWQQAAEGYQLLGRLPVTRQPVIVTHQKTNGWRDIVRATGGGGLPSSYYLIRYHKGHYDHSDEVASNSTITGIGFFDRPLNIIDGIPFQTPQP